MTQLLNDYSLEITAKDEQGLSETSRLLADGTDVSVTFLPTENFDSRVTAATTVRRLGLVPIPHISARRLQDAAELEHFLQRLVADAAVDHVFVIAGDPPAPLGPFEDSLSIIRSGALVRHGIRRVGIAGYPDGHPVISDEKLWDGLKSKLAELDAQHLSHEIITQFSFDADAVLDWLKRVRDAGITTPVKIGIPGPANVKSLLRYAKRCGVGVSARVMVKYGLSLTRVLSPAGPDALVTELETHLDPAIHGKVSVHLYPFGGIRRTVEWVAQYRQAVCAA